MTTTHHTALPFGGPLTSAAMEAPLSQLDAAIQAITVGSGGWATTLDSLANAGQRVVPVTSTDNAVVGMPVYIGLTSGTHEVGVIDTISAGVSVTLVANLASTYAAGTPISATPAEVADARGGYATLGEKVRSVALDVKDYGPTGTADDTATVQAWLDDVKATGRPGYLSDGTYIVNPLTISTAGTIVGLHIFGAGRTKSILRAKAGAGDLLTLTGSFHSARLHDFGIDGTGGTGHGLYYAETTGYLYESSLEGLSVNNCAKNGIYIKSSFANRYVNITVGGNLWDQMKVWGHGYVDVYERIDIVTTVNTSAVTLQTSAAADDIIDATAHGFVAGDLVRFPTLTGGTGLVVGMAYYVLAANLTANTFQVGTTPGGAAVDFTTDITAGTVRAVGYAGIRSLGGGTFIGCNGIYTTTIADGPMFKLGGDGSPDSDGRTAYPIASIVGVNVESFKGTGILLVNSPTNPIRLIGVNFATGSGAANCRAIDAMASSVNTPLSLSGVRFSLIGGATWANGYAIHGRMPVVSDGAATGEPLAVWGDSVGLAYPIIQRVFGTGNANASVYGHKQNQLAGATDIGYLASARLGNSLLGANYVDRTAAAAMPTSGTYRIGDIVDNCSHAITELGTAGSKYTLAGWRRLTDGSAHVLNTDWVERRELTGN